jgi:hypothetical protein
MLPLMWTGGRGGGAADRGPPVVVTVVTPSEAKWLPKATRRAAVVEAVLGTRSIVALLPR